VKLRRRIHAEQAAGYCDKNQDGERYHVYITNISDELLIAKDIADLYRGRWKIELAF
jgi:IS4 transposase